ncbi:unnamed protein product [Coregonus sp. 'balchen']|nr:unnamed protein product [Coregonus sp. 'balchen']
MSRLCVVCGGSRGIGRAVSRLLAERGCRVAVVSRNQDAANATVLSLAGADHMAFRCDVSKGEEVQKTFEMIQKTCGNISYLVNAAGINRLVSYLQNSHDSPKQGWSVAEDQARGHGSVVGLKGNAGQCVYSASKAGLEGFTRSLAKEVASRSVRVNLLAPGLIRTDMTVGLREGEGVRTIPLGRFGEPEEVAKAALFLLESPYITGQVLVVDGGLQLAM